MRINSKLRIASLVPVVMAVIIGSAFIFSYYRMKEVQVNSQTFRNIANSTGELNSLATEYILYHTERPKQQFLELHDLTTRLITVTRFHDEEQRRLYDSIRVNTSAIRDFFLKLVSNYDSFMFDKDNVVLRGVEERLGGQIIVKSRQVAADVSRMEKLMEAKSTAAGTRTNTLLFFVIAIAALSLTFVLVRTGKSITFNLDKLRKGTEVVAAGDLHHRIGIEKGDEIGDVSRAFDLMTDQLKATTVSRDELSREVEERKRAQEELRAQREWLRVTLNSIGDAVLATDAEGRVIFMNPVGAALTGWKTDEAEGKPSRSVFRIINEKTRKEADDVVALVLSKGRTLALANHTALLAQDGREIPIEDSAAPITDGSGDIIGVVVVFHDVSKKRRAEEALRESEQRYKSLHGELEVRVQERTAELERKNQELQEFAFVASHDLNEPLRKIQTFGSLLASKAADCWSEEQRNYISRMTGSAGRMRELLAALLNYSRIESKGEPLRITRLDHLVRDVVSDMEVRILDAGAQVKVGPLPAVWGDPNLLRQLFQNLIGNAIKYRRPEVKLVIEVSGEETNGQCRILVEDNGIGFDEKYLGKIFQPFQRLHGKNEYSGTGIGLAICRKVVERHGGTMTARSTPGKGSTFIVTLPVNGGKR